MTGIIRRLIEGPALRLVDAQRAEIVHLRGEVDMLRRLNERLHLDVDVAFQRGQLVEHTRAAEAQTP